MQQTKTLQVGNILVDIYVTTDWNDDNHDIENNIMIYLAFIYSGATVNRVCWMNLDSRLHFGKRPTKDEMTSINNELLNEALLWMTTDYLEDEVDRQYKIAGYLNEILKNGGYKHEPQS